MTNKLDFSTSVLSSKRAATYYRSRTRRSACAWNVVGGVGCIVVICTSFSMLRHVRIPPSCERVMADVSRKDAHRCAGYEKLAISETNCTGRTIIVPRILHSVGREKETFIETAASLSNPTFRRNRHDDISGAEYVLEKCGVQIAAAYRCLIPGSYRADLFRFCALFAEGGVYVDEDIVPLVPLEDIVSMCDVATLGHDFPSSGRPAKQMKILAATPFAPIMRCALDSIVSNVRGRVYPRSALEITGPLLLQKCYAEFGAGVEITYIDTRKAIWPFTGLRAGERIVAYEYPNSPRHFCLEQNCEDSLHYAAAFKRKDVYSETCNLT